VGCGAEASAGLAPDGVAAPAQVAEGDVLVRVGGGQGGFPVTVALLALDQRAADEHDAVAVLEFELGRRGRERGEEKEQREKLADHGESPREAASGYWDHLSNWRRWLAVNFQRGRVSASSRVFNSGMSFFIAVS